MQEAGFGALPSAGRKAQEFAIAAIDHALPIGREAHDLGLERAGFPGFRTHPPRAKIDGRHLAVAGPGASGIDASESPLEPFAALAGQGRVSGPVDQRATKIVGGGNTDRPVIIERKENAEGLMREIGDRADEYGPVVKPGPDQTGVVAPLRGERRPHRRGCRPTCRKRPDVLGDSGRVLGVPEDRRIGCVELRIDREIATPNLRRGRRCLDPERRRNSPRSAAGTPRQGPTGRAYRNGRNADPHASRAAWPISRSRAPLARAGR